VSLEGDKKGAGFQCGFDMQAKWMGEVVEEVDTVKKKGKK
jgi:predicted small metal-binding protein